jgi:TfoX/Sxy family transcriptional regulator of competence genes
VAYDEKLAARVRALLAERDDVEERPMFGGLTFMLGGNMCCGVNRDELIVRLDPAAEDAALGQPHARPMDLTGRRMRGFVTVRPEGLKGRALNRWVGQAVARSEALPAKQSQQKRTGRG